MATVDGHDEPVAVGAAANHADIRALGARIARAGVNGSRLWLRWLAMMLFVAAIMTTLSAGAGPRPVAAAALVLAGIAAGLLAARPPRSVATAAWSGTYTITESGLRRRNATVDTTVAWSSIDLIEADAHRAFVMFAGSGWVIPRRGFDDVPAFDAFVGQLRAHRSAAGARGPVDGR